MMTELEMSLTLGIISEPEKNFVKVDPVLHAEVMYLKHVFSIIQCQRSEVGRLTGDTWAALLPWHSLN
jgi:hypothetical protein